MFSNSTENITHTFVENAEIIDIITICVGISTVLLHCIVLVTFLGAKNLRPNLFYRILMPVNLMEVFVGVSVVTLLLFDIFIGSGNICLLLLIICIASGMTTASQLSIVSVDRYQSTMSVSKLTLYRRRYKLVKVALGLAILAFMICTVSYVLLFRLSDETCRPINIFPLNVIVAVWYTICIFLVELPFSLMALAKIRKCIRTVSVQVRVIHVQPLGDQNVFNNEDIHYPTPTVQKNRKLKFAAIKTLLLLVISHVVTFLPQIVLISLAENMIYDLKIITTFLNYSNDYYEFIYHFFPVENHTNLPLY